MRELEELVLEHPEEINKRAGVPFVVFTYEPENEIAASTAIDNFIDKLEFNGVDVADIDMRDLVFNTLEERGILENVIELERRNSAKLLDGLKSSLLAGEEMGELATSIAAKAENAETVVVSRMGVLYPFASASTLLSQLEANTPPDTPLVFCYPASVEGNSLKFLDESEGQYYRARVI